MQISVFPYEIHRIQELISTEFVARLEFATNVCFICALMLTFESKHFSDERYFHLS